MYVTSCIQGKVAQEESPQTSRELTIYTICNENPVAMLKTFAEEF